MTLPEDRLDAPQLRPWLGNGRFGHEIHHFDQVGSTQRVALEAAQGGAAEGVLFVAEGQTGGRGRHGHAWESASGEGIYASLVLRPHQALASMLLLTLAAGLAVADAVTEVCALQPEIRWPNDLLLGGKKFCGLLVETSAEAGMVLHAVLGIGINVHQRSFPAELEALATSLDLHLPQPVVRPQLCAAVLRHVEDRYRAFEAGKHPALLEEFERRCSYARGLDVVVGGAGADAYCGRTEGVEPSGFLRVRLADGTVRLVISGDVRPGFPLS